MSQAKLPSKWLIVGAMMTFVGTAFLGIAINSTLFRHGFDISKSISHYVGLEVWSALFFVLGNIFVTWFMGRYLWQIGLAWKMPKFYFWLVIAVATTLMELSLCPSGMFDEGDTTSLITWIHVLASRVMFIAMMLVSTMIVVCKHTNRFAHLMCVLFIIYAAVCVVGFMGEASWFINNSMIFESFYIIAFMIALASCDEKRERLSDLAR